jgi:uncharacterized protein with HEPN domain
MASGKSPLARLLHIADEARAIGEATSGLKFESFKESWLLRRAVEHGLLIVSEAAKSLPAETKEAAAGITWRKIATLGNFLRHEYCDVDSELICAIMRDNLPDLLKASENLAEALRNESLPA